MAKFEKGNIPWNKGIPCSDEVKAKISKKKMGQKHTPETQAKINLNLIEGGKATRFKKGEPSPRKGTKSPRYTAEELKAHQKEWRQRTKEERKAYNLAWGRANKEKLAKYHKKTRQKHSDRVNATNARRHAEKLNRTPIWLTEDDLWLIKEAYHLAKQRTALHGFEWHVDHIIPLKGKIVSGLHVPSNLQVIEGSINIRKNNRFEGEIN